MIRLFTGISQDDSALSRTDSYDLAAQFIERSPVFGRGLSTFLPSYRILDNQYLGLLIETGVVGTAAFLALLTTALVVAYRMSVRLPGPVRLGRARKPRARSYTVMMSFSFSTSSLSISATNLSVSFWISSLERRSSSSEAV